MKRSAVLATTGLLKLVMAPGESPVRHLTLPSLGFDCIEVPSSDGEKKLDFFLIVSPFDDPTRYHPHSIYCDYMRGTR